MRHLLFILCVVLSLVYFPYRSHLKGSLRSHIETVHEGKERKYKAKPKCEFCTDKFPSFAELREHVNKIHWEIKPKCNKCNMKFLRKRSLEVHISEKHGNEG